MSRIEIYTTEMCPYCIMAKELLEEKGIEIEEIRVDLDRRRMVEAVARSGGRRTVPQIFIDNRHIGGYDDLCALEDGGKLDELLSF